MSDERLIRLRNFQRLCKARGLTPAHLSIELGSTYPYWRDLLAGQKSFGEKAARRIEEGLKLPRGWLDKEGGDVPPAAPIDRENIPSITVTDELPKGMRVSANDVTAALRLLAFVFERSSPIARAAAAPALQALALSPGDWKETARVINRLIDDGLGESLASPGKDQAASGRS